MSRPSSAEPDLLFSVSAVEEELERIFKDPGFSESAILKKFLSFIVQETILGRSSCLKEYTIALNVLQKPVDFNPQENAIVRIHAGRLRRMLKRYYQDTGRNDQIVITMPKGKYVPFFADRRNPLDAAIIDEALRDNSPVMENDSSISLAILPFICPNESTGCQSFSEGLCLQMSSLLMCLEDVAMMSYHAIKSFAQTHPDYAALVASFGLNYIVTGSVQIARGKMRVNIQMVECDFYRQMWSQTFERRVTKANVFDVQDEIATYVISQVEELRNKKRNPRKLLMHFYV